MMREEHSVIGAIADDAREPNMPHLKPVFHGTLGRQRLEFFASAFGSGALLQADEEFRRHCVFRPITSSPDHPCSCVGVAGRGAHKGMVMRFVRVEQFDFYGRIISWRKSAAIII